MTLSLEQLGEIAEPFYRVTVKAIVFDSQNRLVLVRNGDDELEILGGGLEAGESLADCVRRETQEEAGVDLQNVSGVIEVQTATSYRYKWPVCRLVVRAELVSEAYKPGDGMQEVVPIAMADIETANLTEKDKILVPLIQNIWLNKEQ